jgi:hypothetical protein
LQLQQLQDEADEARRGARSPRDRRAAAAADGAKLGGLVEQARRGEAEAVLLPVDCVIDAGAQDLLDEVLFFFSFGGGGEREGGRVSERIVEGGDSKENEREPSR